MDLALVAQLSTMKTSIPFLVFFDGFRTSHELQKIEVIDYDTMKALDDGELIEAFRARGLNPANPRIKVGQQAPDVYFPTRDQQPAFPKGSRIIQDTMNAVADKIVALQTLDYVVSRAKNYRCNGQRCETIQETTSILNKERGMKLGLVSGSRLSSFDVELSKLPACISQEDLRARSHQGTGLHRRTSLS
jgi:pyruvate-ferredoxin/flavodoxin oxidoreductase